MESDRFIKQVLLEEGSAAYPLTHRIVANLPGIPVLSGDEAATKAGPPYGGKEKDTLRLLHHPGEFLKPCPGTNGYICCGYQILHLAANCPLDCSYCILQSYFNQPDLRVFVNAEQGIEGALKVIDGQPGKVFRVGTGEFTDSLAIDDVSEISSLLLPRFSKRKNAVLELKTKTARVGHLIDSPWRDRIVVSWSLNSSFVSNREEHRAVSLKSRLEAARQCQSEGFTLGFHFDPLIYHPRWEEDYLKTLELMAACIDPKGIIWMSMGSFRFMPALKAIILKRHPNTRVLDGEFIRGVDGKMRYFKPMRIELYAFMREHLEKWHQGLGLYLCMESDDVWQKSLGWSPMNSAGLCRYLDNRVKEIFG